MRDFNDFKSELDCYNYTEKELEILYGVRKKISTKEFFRLVSKTERLSDVWNHGMLLTEFEIDGKFARRVPPFGQF